MDMTHECNTQRMQLDSDLRDLCAELDCLQERAMRRVGLVDNEFQDATWAEDQADMIARLRQLVDLKYTLLTI